MNGSKTTYGTTVDAVVCKTGFYAWNDGVTATKQGCYATSTLTSAPLNLITANSPTSLTNCEYITSVYKSSSKYWTCLQCKSGYTISNASLSNASCAANVSSTMVANCDKGSVSSSTHTCLACKTGYVKNSTGSKCVAETTATKNCASLDSTEKLCSVCKNNSYFNLTVCVASSHLQAIAAFMIAVMVYLQ